MKMPDTNMILRYLLNDNEKMQMKPKKLSEKEAIPQ